MKIDQQPLDTCEVQLTVEVDDEQVLAAKRAAARRLSQKYRIPGFRKGKAPYEIVLRTLGESVVWEEALDDLGQTVYQAALDETQIDPYAPGSLVDAKVDPVVFKFNVPLAPEVDLGNYRAARLSYTEPHVTEEAVNDAVEHLRERQAVLEPVERPAQLEDVITVEIRGIVKMPKEGGAAKAPERGSTAEPESDPLAGEFVDEFLIDDKNAEVLLDSKLDWPMPGFAEKLVGMAVGDERHIEMAFPDDYANESLRGRMAHFDVKCAAVKSRTLPELDDELAKSLGDFESVADMRLKVRDSLERRARQQKEDAYAKAAVDMVVAGATIKFPPILLSREIDEMTEDLDRRLREQRLTLNDYLKINHLTPEQWRENLQPHAGERLRRSLVLGKIVELENIEVSDDEIDENIETMLAPFGENAGRLREALVSEAGKRSVRFDLLTKKAVKRIVAIAKGEVIEPVEGQAETARADPVRESGRSASSP